jgi:hypothetical protein
MIKATILDAESQRFLAHLKETCGKDGALAADWIERLRDSLEQERQRNVELETRMSAIRQASTNFSISFRDGEHRK